MEKVEYSFLSKYGMIAFAVLMVVLSVYMCVISTGWFIALWAVLLVVNCSTLHMSVKTLFIKQEIEEMTKDY